MGRRGHLGWDSAYSAGGRLCAGLLIILAAFMLLTGQSASASKGWCSSDPVVIIDGVLADVIVSAPLDAPLQVTGPTQIIVTVPTGVQAQLVLSGLGFGRGEEVTFVESPALRVTEQAVPVRIAVYVPGRDNSMPVRVDFAPRVIGILGPASAEGTANDWTRLKTAL